MAKHHPDLIFCRKQAGVAIGRLCEKCDGKCVICDSYVRPCTLVRICDECNYGSYQGRCVICGGPGVSDAYYCKECTIQEKDVCVFVFTKYADSGERCVLFLQNMLIQEKYVSVFVFTKYADSGEICECVCFYKIC
ncbi:PHD finger-like domain-containing protein 5A isoform X1 [Limulus polyphemus]|uniref:PHD finger-like domain-containing protein 5A isoform X1 n=1 Tax=Limulus polyphemus TaxID=6850 RepID=A0ABM1TN50_LIMPO|nr:PHD finger-like domain-containing protein 5A isoform X1 [Limulus polyphemus]